MPGGKPGHGDGGSALHSGAAVPPARFADAGTEARVVTALDRRSASAIAAAVNARQASAVAVAEDTLDRIAAHDAVQPQIWISKASRDDLLAAARAIDARVAAGEALPLAGVPFAVKDNIDVAGFETTAACPAFACWPSGSATVVERLLAAGALCVGKTNLDQFATGLNGTRSPYGAPRNAYNLAWISGGSSSGSVGHGGGRPGGLRARYRHSRLGPHPGRASITLIGFKPSRAAGGATSGLVPACRTLDCITVFTGTLADAGLVDHVVADFDREDVFSRTLDDVTRARRRIGVPRADQRPWFGDLESISSIRQAWRRLTSSWSRSTWRR